MKQPKQVSTLARRNQACFLPDRQHSRCVSLSSVVLASASRSPTRDTRSLVVIPSSSSSSLLRAPGLTRYRARLPSFPHRCRIRSSGYRPWIEVRRLHAWMRPSPIRAAAWGIVKRDRDTFFSGSNCHHPFRARPHQSPHVVRLLQFLGRQLLGPCQRALLRRTLQQPR